jgi:hypothetical protein
MPMMELEKAAPSRTILWKIRQQAQEFGLITACAALAGEF